MACTDPQPVFHPRDAGRAGPGGSGAGGARSPGTKLLSAQLRALASGFPPLAVNTRGREPAAFATIAQRDWALQNAGPAGPPGFSGERGGRGRGWVEGCGRGRGLPGLGVSGAGLGVSGAGLRAGPGGGGAAGAGGPGLLQQTLPPRASRRRGPEQVGRGPGPRGRGHLRGWPARVLGRDRPWAAGGPLPHPRRAQGRDSRAPPRAARSPGGP